MEAQLRTPTGWVIARLELGPTPGHGAYADLHELDVAIAESRGERPPTLAESRPAHDRFPMLSSLDPTGDREYASSELELLTHEIDAFSGFLHTIEQARIHVFAALVVLARTDPDLTLVVVGD